MANIDYDRNTDFNVFDSYAIQAEPVRTTDDTRIKTPFMQQRIVNAINISLAKKGLKNLTADSDLQIKYYLDLKQDFEVDGSSVSFGFGSYGYHSAVGLAFAVPVGETYSVDKLVLTIDMFSTKTKKLLWRGSLAYRLANGATPESNAKMINALVEEILQRFPPK